MKNLLKTLPVLLILLIPIVVNAQHQLVIYYDGDYSSYYLSDISSLTYSSEAEDILINVGDNAHAYPLAAIEKILIIDELSSPEPGSSELPTEFILDSPYPNPFNPSVSIPFSLPNSGQVKMAVVDILGRTVWNETANLEAGSHLIHLNLTNWNGGKISSGTYFFRMNYSGEVQTARLTVIK